MARIIQLKTFSDGRGRLNALDRELPFPIRRVYYIYGVENEDVIRGGHRHHRNSQALICVQGKCVISNNDGKLKRKFFLDSPEKCLILEPADWHTMGHFSKDAILLVLASEPYDVNDYIDEPYDD